MPCVFTIIEYIRYKIHTKCIVDWPSVKGLVTPFLFSSSNKSKAPEYCCQMKNDKRKSEQIKKGWQHITKDSHLILNHNLNQIKYTNKQMNGFQFWLLTTILSLIYPWIFRWSPSVRANYIFINVMRRCCSGVKTAKHIQFSSSHRIQ